MPADSDLHAIQNLIAQLGVQWQKTREEILAADDEAAKPAAPAATPQAAPPPAAAAAAAPPATAAPAQPAVQTPAAPVPELTYSPAPVHAHSTDNYIEPSATQHSSSSIPAAAATFVSSAPGRTPSPNPQQQYPAAAATFVSSGPGRSHSPNPQQQYPAAAATFVASGSGRTPSPNPQQNYSSGGGGIAATFIGQKPPAPVSHDIPAAAATFVARPGPSSPAAAPVAGTFVASNNMRRQDQPHAYPVSPTGQGPVAGTFVAGNIHRQPSPPQPASPYGASQGSGLPVGTFAGVNAQRQNASPQPSYAAIPAAAATFVASSGARQQAQPQQHQYAPPPGPPQSYNAVPQSFMPSSPPQAAANPSYGGIPQSFMPSGPSSTYSQPQQQQTPPPAYVPRPQPTPQTYPATPAPTPTAAYAAVPSPAAPTPTSLTPTPVAPTPVSPAASGLGVEAKRLAALKKANDMKNGELKARRQAIDIAFVMDLTGTMVPWIAQARVKMHEIIRHVKEKSPEATVRVGFVGYGDYNNESPPKAYIKVVDFAEPEVLMDKIANLRKHDGWDIPEDVLGGLDAALHQLMWWARTKLLIHIADDPAHNKEFHDYRHGEDRYAEGPDPSGRGPEYLFNLLRMLCNKDIEYHFFHVDDATTKMERRFDQELRKYGSQLYVHSMTTDVADFMPAVIAAVTESMTRSFTRG
ncbi:hypothetical protein BJ742DRAFT_871711 [Cladochytrium replicatum]|nr:hypothetical protein BJ742DRAFT_871711 [Cladochytrium replicatum]